MLQIVKMFFCSSGCIQYSFQQQRKLLKMNMTKVLQNNFSFKTQNNSIISKNTCIELEKIFLKTTCIHPYFLIIGEIHDSKHIIVYFDSIKYKISTIIKAVDTCFTSLMLNIS